MDFNLHRDTDILSRTPRVLRELLSGLAPEWSHSNYGQSTWSPREVLGHLIHGEQADWIPRARIILAGDESATFTPFDREGHAALCRDKSVAELLDQFAALRETNLAQLAAFRLTPLDLARRACHPAFGPVTLGQLLCTWVVHDLNHVAQIAKAMAYQHQAEVGPWEQYLSILAPPNPR